MAKATTYVMVMATRLADNKEGKGEGGGGKGDDDGNEGSGATKRAMATSARGMAKATLVADKQHQRLQ